MRKFSRDGQVLLTIGTKGEAGEWNEAAGSRKLNQPNDVAVADNGDIFIVQGHTPGPRGDARVLKFDKTGRFLAPWGGKGTAPGQFEVAHGIAIDAKGLLWVADRENQRIQVFDQNGHVRARDEVRRPAVRDGHRASVRLHGQRIRRPGACGWISTARCWRSPDGPARAPASSARRTSSR